MGHTIRGSNDTTFEDKVYGTLIPMRVGKLNMEQTLQRGIKDENLISINGVENYYFVINIYAHPSVRMRSKIKRKRHLIKFNRLILRGSAFQRSTK